jgi:hypothetical protein
MFFEENVPNGCVFCVSERGLRLYIIALSRVTAQTICVKNYLMNIIEGTYRAKEQLLVLHLWPTGSTREICPKLLLGLF